MSNNAVPVAAYMACRSNDVLLVHYPRDFWLVVQLHAGMRAISERPQRLESGVNEAAELQSEVQQQRWAEADSLPWCPQLGRMTNEHEKL